MDTLRDRLARHLTTMAERRGFRKALAQRLGYKQAAISPYVKGERAITVDMLEVMAELSGTPIAELVAPSGSVVHQLHPDEAALLRHLRKWDHDIVLGSLVKVFALFADEPSATRLGKNHHAVFRQLSFSDRQYLHGLAQLMAKTALPPELRASIERQVEVEASGKKPRSMRMWSEDDEGNE